MAAENGRSRGSNLWPRLAALADGGGLQQQLTKQQLAATACGEGALRGRSATSARLGTAADGGVSCGGSSWRQEAAAGGGIGLRLLFTQPREAT